ncbi:MAG: hypothetical protein D6743_02395 [Calditrichaeota bacterium]|nr:MAG: hypothetical protein D6743_02395 [Calditrichota bacterium]
MAGPTSAEVGRAEKGRHPVSHGLQRQLRPLFQNRRTRKGHGALAELPERSPFLRGSVSVAGLGSGAGVQTGFLESGPDDPDLPCPRADGIGPVKARSEKTRTKTLDPAYPFRWEGLEDFAYPKDARGLPLVDYGSKWGQRHNPVTIAQFGLFHLQRFAHSRDEAALGPVRAAVDWLVENLRPWRGEIGAWIYDVDLDFYGPTAPWISGMAQGQGISLLLRAYPRVKSERSLECSRQAFRAFLKPVAEGGVVSSFPDGTLVFEEFPTAPRSLVLNGHLFALLGIYDFSEFWQDKAARELFSVAVDGLKRNLSRYDTGFWNLYDLHPTRRLASPMYVKVHVQLLNILSELTGDDFFAAYAGRWQQYLKSPVCRVRWLLGKIAEKIRLRV